MNSTHSLMRCDLSSPLQPSWSPCEIKGYNFKDYSLRQALVLSKYKIVYFGSMNTQSTFVLEVEKHSLNLEVVREDQ